MALTDAQKGLYLQEMGIQAYFPRRPLPGAKPSLAYAANILRARVTPEAGPVNAAKTAKDVLQLLNPVSAPVTQPKAEAQSRPQTADNTVSEKARALAQSLAAPSAKASPMSDQAEPRITEQASAQVQAVKSTEEVAALRFAFAYIPVSEHLAVITELPWSKSASLSSASLVLLSGILKALGIQVETQHLHPMVFTWPLFEGAGLELDADNARKALEGFVSKRIRLRAVKNLLVMAQESAPLLFPEGFLADKGVVFQHPRLALRVIMTHSLNAMEPAQDPALAATIKERKGSTWKTLQPLQASLNGTDPSA